MFKRLMKQEVSTARSTPSDWSFLALLWLSGMTGFALEIALYLPQPQAWSYWMLLAHLVVVMELLFLLPFTKFAHAIYRIVALYFYALKPLPEAETQGAQATD
jgi:nitrate reductase gamma subunit